MVIKLIKTNLIEVFAVEHPRFKDHRGSFIESFNENLYKKIFGKKIYGNNYKEHPYYKKFKGENFKFMCFKFKKIYKL